MFVLKVENGCTQNIQLCKLADRLLLCRLKRKETGAKSVVCACKTNKFFLEQCFLIHLDERKYTSSASICSCSQLDGYNYCSSKTYFD